MNSSGIISTRYARALFSVALKNKVEDVLFSEMKQVTASFSNNKTLASALNNPVLDFDKKLDLMKFAAGTKASDVYTRFAQLLLQQKRENHLKVISLVYADLYRKHKNINVGRLVTASVANDETIGKIKTYLQKHQSGTLEVESIVDPSIGGGFILYVDTYRLDASVASQLRKIKKQLLAQ